MSTFNKLVRDKIPNIVSASGRKPVTHSADDKEYWEALKNKLIEEVDEFIVDENIEELADILEVIDAITKHKKINRASLDVKRLEKKDKAGGFDKKIILDSVEE